ncbi:hypothetical protein [Acetilactobacillus jinshanensis]|uniref:Uncharacterized protein n=1 Tax=Acetilactobacillus jinshanensis TaxID=1720083 RepID=A0A4P6ZLZ0_9LACO|nr:hypothetical protein [Acetilactobacillus jinshanensis]QBP18250.1 hypothetical protein ELX58_03670 [Acetilactobacillus jinshanensis]URL61966.1 hypothetical protein HGK75_07985 [uncultured bacterium]
MNPEDKVTYIALKSLKGVTKDNVKAYQDMVKKANQVDPQSTHLVADTLRLDDFNHNQFLNCQINLKDNIHPEPDTKKGKGNEWVTPIGKLELKRLEYDYEK